MILMQLKIYFMHEFFLHIIFSYDDENFQWKL